MSKSPKSDRLPVVNTATVFITLDNGHPCRPGEIAEVEDTPRIRRLVEAGFLNIIASSQPEPLAAATSDSKEE